MHARTLTDHPLSKLILLSYSWREYNIGDKDEINTEHSNRITPNQDRCLIVSPNNSLVIIIATTPDAGSSHISTITTGAYLRKFYCGADTKLCPIASDNYGLLKVVIIFLLYNTFQWQLIYFPQT